MATFSTRGDESKNVPASKRVAARGPRGRLAPEVGVSDGQGHAQRPRLVHARGGERPAPQVGQVVDKVHEPPPIVESRLQVRSRQSQAADLLLHPHVGDAGLGRPLVHDLPQGGQGQGAAPLRAEKLRDDGRRPPARSIGQGPAAFDL
jgi:hypothetical protein